ncbi:MAG: N-6 DNA methylase, partial [Bacteroidia bacterium]
NGTMAIVLPHGVLYRGGAEKHILKYLIEDRDYLDAIIGLPDNIFYGTTYATCILVFKKCRENPNDILFIDASLNFEKIKKQNVLRQQDIDKIISTYRNRDEKKDYSRKVTKKEIRKNDYNLNFPRYIDNLEKEDIVDIDFVCDFLKQINQQSNETEKKISKICTELNIPTPEGNNIELLRLYQKGVMQRVFDRKIQFKNKNGKPFPEWDQVKFGSVYTFRTTNSFSRENLNYDSGIIKNIHYGDIHTKFNTLFDIQKEKVPFINSEMNISRIDQGNYCKEGDLILADASEDYADVGKCIELMNLNSEKILPGLHTILARPDLRILQAGFGGFMMKSLKVRTQIKKIAQGTKVLGISPTRLAEIDLCIPSLEEQKRIVELLTAIDEKISYSINQMARIEEYKKKITK